MGLGPTAVIVVALLVGSDACSPPAGWRPLSVDELMLSADQVLYAGVRRTFAERPTSPSLYTAEVDVRCIMKGERTPSIVNITGVGFLPGMCTSTTLTVGQRYVIMAYSSEQNDQFRVRRTDEIDWDELPDYTSACGLSNMYPLGVEEEEASWSCPTPPPPGDCLDSDDFPPPFQQPSFPEREIRESSESEED